ncbi:hypothetical protein ACTOB_007868 [Actinoplanes oblitus]|uniref:Uncharacterized protein n=1 Tax=Actinoplanes oblitus TaxID=3040509 RepID=A0ABY8WCZ4_9ACTN|nr:hypothetical protein [Actinoplanes oblitus]WIM95739.1 hypothetical protein ACTOB_007868 [Actinoplanes oblitus]
MSEPPPQLDEELLGLAYMQVVTRHASEAWHTGRGDRFLQLLAKACRACGIEPLSDRLVDHLADAYDDPQDGYQVRFSLAASAMWETGNWAKLLIALHLAATPERLTAEQPARRTRGPVSQRPRRRTRAAIIAGPSRNPGPPTDKP